MKRKLLICSSLITFLLSVFYVPIFAEETVQDSSNLHSLSDGVYLDSYFYENYDLLPYIQSTGSEYIDTDISGSSNLKIRMKMSDPSLNGAGPGTFFGNQETDKNFVLQYYLGDNNRIRILYYVDSRAMPFLYQKYNIYDVVVDQNSLYINGNLLYTGTAGDFDSSVDMSIFARNTGVNNSYYGIFKLYSFSIYDYSLNDGEGGYLRYYYPAKAKTSGSIGLYDAVNKTFIVSGSNTQFSNPTNEYVENFQISSFLTASLTWIGQIFTAIIDMPIVIIFMAIGLAGAMFRWGRRIVHF